jgi:hypothetical protein
LVRQQLELLAGPSNTHSDRPRKFSFAECILKYQGITLSTKNAKR